MLSRATLATIKNTRASTSGVPMFDPNSNLIFGREYVLNDNFDSICGAGFVVYGSWKTDAGCERPRSLRGSSWNASPGRANLVFKLLNGWIATSLRNWWERHNRRVFSPCSIPPSRGVVELTVSRGGKVHPVSAGLAHAPQVIYVSREVDNLITRLRFCGGARAKQGILKDSRVHYGSTCLGVVR